MYLFAEAGKYEPWQEGGWKKYPGDLRQAPDGSWFGCFSEGITNPHEGGETHGAWYYNSCSAIDRLLKWDRDWKPLWSVGRHSPDEDHETGSTAMPRGLLGLAHGCVVWADASDEETAPPTVWTEDGLYVDELLRVPLDGVPKEAHGMRNANEYAAGRLWADPKTGEVLYFAIGSGGGSPVYRITGWNGWHRAQGTVSVGETAPKVARRGGTGLRAEYFNNPDCSGVPALSRLDRLVFFNWGSSFPDRAINAETFSVRWSGSYEAAPSGEGQFEIHGSFPWRPRGHPLWTRLWLGGQKILESGPGARAPQTVRVRIRSGERLSLRLEAGFKKGEAAIALCHDTPELDRRAIPVEFLYPEPGANRPLEVILDRRPGGAPVRGPPVFQL